MFMRALFPPVAALLLASGAGMAQTDSGPMETDRPGFMDSLSVLPAGTAQLESGAGYSVAPGGSSLGLGGHLLRIGIAKRWEVRLVSDGYIFAGNSGSGWGGGSAGVKIKLAGERRWSPAVSVGPAVLIPISRDASGANTACDPAFRVNWSKGLTHGFGVGGAMDLVSASDKGGRYGRHAASFAVNRGIRGLSVFGEAFTWDRVERGGGRKTFIDGGFAAPLTKDVQLDVSVGRGVGPASRERFIAAGISVRRHGFEGLGFARRVVRQ